MKSKTIYSFHFLLGIFLTQMLNMFSVQAQYHVFVDDPVQRKLCRVKTSELLCDQDKKCAWNDFQLSCNEFGYQPTNCEEVCSGLYCLRLSLVYCMMFNSRY